MLKCPVSEWPKKAIGQKVSVNNKNGILRFVGTTNFADGIWCGIELEEGAGENDGMVNNVQYFTCRKNHGIFIPASDLVFSNNGSVENNLMSTDNFSDILSNTNFVAENYNSSVTLNDSQSASPEILDEKNKSYTVSKEALIGKLSTINEEMVESIYPDHNNISYLDIENELNKCKTFLNEVCSSIQNEENSVFQKSFEEEDSNDSLGILPFQVLEDTQFGDNSLLEIDNTKKHLNSTVNLLKNNDKWLECQNLSYENDNEFLFPHTSIMPKYPILSKNDECPTNMPKFASTPIHEINYSYRMDEDAVASSDHFVYDLETPINASETFLGKHLEFVLNKTTEIGLNSENISSIISIECKLRNNDTRNQTPEIVNTTCIISDPVNENLIAHNEFNCTAVERCSIKSCKDLVKFSIQDHPLPDYNNFIQNIVPNAVDATADCYSQGNESGENILNITCNILDPKLIGNEDENILNVTCNILEPKQIGNKDDENILNVTCNILEPKQIAKYIENLDDKNCIPTNILNATVSYSDIAEINEIANDKAEILNTTVCYKVIAKNDEIANDKAEILNTTVCYPAIAENDEAEILNTTISYPVIVANDEIANEAQILNTTVSYSGIAENNKTPNDRAEILNTTVSYSEKSDNENDNADILNTTYKKIEEPCELEENVRILKTVQPPFKSKENEKLPFGAKKNVTLNSAFKNGSSVYKEESGKVGSIFDKQLRKSVGCFVKPTSIVNPEYKNKARRNSTSSSLRPASKAGEATVNKARRNSESGCLHTASKIGESTVHCFNKNLHGKHSIETNKSVRKSFVNRNQFPDTNTSFNKSRTAFNCLSVKSNFNEVNHEVIDSISEEKLKDGQVINETESYSPLVPNVCKTVVKKPRLSLQNVTEINHEIIDSISESKLNDGPVFNKTESFSTLLPDVKKTVVKKNRFSMQRFTGYEHGKTNLAAEIKDSQVSKQTKNHLLPDASKTVVKKPQCSANFGYKSNSQEPCKKPLFKSQNKTVVTTSENKSLKVPTIKNRELPVQKPFKDSVIPCLKKPGFSAANSDEKNHHISRIPGKCVLSQKNIFSNPASMEANVANLHKPHSFIPAGKITTKQGIVKPSALKSSTASLPTAKSDLNDLMPIPDQENKFKQTSQTTKTFCNKEIDRTSARNSQNSDHNCIKKAGLNDTIIVPNHKNNNVENQDINTLSKSTKPASRIPSFSQNNQKANAGVKSSLMIPRIAYKGKSQSQHNIR